MSIKTSKTTVSISGRVMNQKGQTLVSALVSVAITSIMAVAFMNMSDTMTKSSRHFQKTISRNLFEVQVVGALGQPNLCACNLAGLTVPTSGSGPIAVNGISTNSATCPAPAAGAFDLYQAVPAGGYALEGGLRVQSIDLRDVVNTGGDDYSAVFRINYSSQDGIALKPKDFFMYFTRNTTNPASTPTSPILDSCSVNTTPAGGGSGGEAAPPGTLSGFCSEISKNYGDYKWMGSTSSLVAPARAAIVSVKRNGTYWPGSACSCRSGFSRVTLSSTTADNGEPMNLITTTTSTYTCARL